MTEGSRKNTKNTEVKPDREAERAKLSRKIQTLERKRGRVEKQRDIVIGVGNQMTSQSAPTVEVTTWLV